MGDFIYLTKANGRQKVAYMATLLQDVAVDWWTALLKERHGTRPADYLEMFVLLQKRFGSTTRVDRARANLRNIKQGQSKSVHSYSTRFEGCCPNCRHLTRNVRKPSLSGDCINVSPS